MKQDSICPGAKWRHASTVMLSVSLGASCSVLKDTGRDAVARVEPTAESVSFESQIKPLFEKHCLPCHNGQTAAGDLDLRSRALAFRPSPNGPFIVPGYPDRSKLFRMITLADEAPGAMPPTGHQLTEEQIARVKGWIAQGAHW